MVEQSIYNLIFKGIIKNLELAEKAKGRGLTEGEFEIIFAETLGRVESWRLMKKLDSANESNRQT